MKPLRQSKKPNTVPPQYYVTFSNPDGGNHAGNIFATKNPRRSRENPGLRPIPLP